MMRLIFLLICVACPLLTWAQSECYDEFVIRTNPSEPVNTQFPALTNTFFDWRKSGIPINTEYSNNNLPIASPFFDSEPLADMSDLGDLDMLPEDGWELIDVQNGYEKQGNGTIPIPVKATENVFFILYNKYTALLRILLASTNRVDEFNAAKIKLFLKHKGQIGGKGFNETHASTLDFAMGELRALDAYPYQDPQNIKEPSVASVSKYGTRLFKWFRADFPMTYDPCVCTFKSALFLEVTLVKSAKINITGSIEQIVAQNDNTGKAQVESIGSKLSFFAGKAIEIGGKVVKTFNSLKNDGFVKEQTKIVDANAKAIDDFANGLADNATPKESMKILVQKILTRRTKVSLLEKIFGAGSKFLKFGLKAAPFMGGAFDLINFFVGGGFKKKETTANPISAMNFSVNLKGTIDFETDHQTNYFFNGGSYHYSNPEITETSKKLFYPIYNKKMGVFNLMTTPIMETRSGRGFVLKDFGGRTADIKN